VIRVKEKKDTRLSSDWKHVINKEKIITSIPKRGEGKKKGTGEKEEEEKKRLEPESLISAKIPAAEKKRKKENDVPVPQRSPEGRKGWGKKMRIKERGKKKDIRKSSASLSLTHHACTRRKKKIIRRRKNDTG